MLLRSLTAPLTAIQDFDPSLLPKFARRGIQNVADLLCHYPRKWEDRSIKLPLKNFHHGQVCTEVRVIAHDWIGFGGARTLKVHIEDESCRAALLCFNRPWLKKQLVSGERYRLWGRFTYKYGEIQSSSFEFERISADNEISGFERVAGNPGIAGFGHIYPVYPLTGGLTQAMLHPCVSRALKQYSAELEDELPAEIIERDKLLSKAGAIRAVHFPASWAELEQAKKTLIYEELFYLEIMVGKWALERKGAPSPFRGSVESREENEQRTDYGADSDGLSPLQRRLIERLPFSLTPGQQETVLEINRDMNGAHPMARLLQGDVGSGKTLVSFLAALPAAEDGGQTAIMAPTELLARQHAENASRLLEPLGLRIAFLTGNIKAAGRKELLRNLEAGEIDIVVGTHALFSRDVIYKNLLLVVVDEQHRFGVTQRALIMAKGRPLETRAENQGGPDIRAEKGSQAGRLFTPHLLMMSATPIPRTLALTVFGDMDVSTIRDMPPGRKPVKTHLAKESNENKVYDFVRGELSKGRQAYFVYPLIENGDESDLKDAVSMARRLAKEIFPAFPLALIHSKLDEEEKRRTMENFRKGEIKILAATSVVEVGVDVPNAACMVIEHAERFGLSALHQLRGRVGRGPEQSYCFLVYSDDPGDDGKARLKVMLENSDGFVIAEEDLILRGPGQIAGIEQSGYLPLGLADPVRDAKELVRSRADAFNILETDPGLLLPDHRIIARVLEEAPHFSEAVLYYT
jgi:ATP-dependent DNA helicase RecG